MHSGICSKDPSARTSLLVINVKFGVFDCSGIAVSMVMKYADNIVKVSHFTVICPMQLIILMFCAFMWCEKNDVALFTTSLGKKY